MGMPLKPGLTNGCCDGYNGSSSLHDSDEGVRSTGSLATVNWKIEVQGGRVGVRKQKLLLYVSGGYKSFRGSHSRHCWHVADLILWNV